MVGSSTYYTISKKKSEKNQKSIVLAESKFRGSSSKRQETTGKTSRNKNDKTEQEIEEKLDRSASNERRRCRSGTPGNARGAPTEHFFSRSISIGMFIYSECSVPSRQGSKTPGRLLGSIRLRNYVTSSYCDFDLSRT